jgi:hypothetical protein
MVSIARRMDPDDPVRQAPNTVAFYLAEAIDVIDRKFCPGYAAQHPELVGAFVQATAMDHVSVAARIRINLAEERGPG